MGEAWGGDRRSADARAPHQVHGDGDGGGSGTEPGGKGGGSGREGRLELSVPQVAGSAVAAVVAAKLASNLGVYGTIAGAGVVSVLGTCGGTILQHVFRRTGRRVQEVAVQARPGVLRVVNHAGRTRLDEVAVPEPGPDPAGTDVLPPAADPAGPFRDVNRTAALRGAGGAALFREDASETFGEAAPHAGYGEPTAYRARRRGWKRPVVAVALAFGLTMGGITAYEALAGENISGHGHGTTIGNALTGKTGSSHHDTPQRPTPPPPSTTPHHDTPTATPTPHRTTPTTPPPTDSPAPPPTPSPPTPTPTPTPSLTPTDGDTATTAP